MFAVERRARIFLLAATLGKTSHQYAAVSRAPDDRPQLDRRSAPRLSPRARAGYPCACRGLTDDQDSPQKSGDTACGMARADVPGKKGFGLLAQICSVSGPSGALANCARRSMGIWRTAASYCRKRWMAFQGIVKAPGSST